MLAPGPPQPSRRHRRLSSLNTVSWPNPNELTVSPVPKPRRMSTVTSTGAQDTPETEVKSFQNQMGFDFNTISMVFRRVKTRNHRPSSHLVGNTVSAHR